SDLMTIYSNFAFNFHHEAYDVELMEEDMNYRPLVAFDNGSFAVLFFNQRTGGLMAVNYVNKETLLTEMPYQLNEGSPLPVDITQSMTFDPVQSNQAIYVMNLVKQQESQAAFSVSTQSQKDAQTLYQTMANHTPTILSANRQAELLQTREEHTAIHPFHLTKDEFSLVVKTSKLSLREPAGIFQEPVYDSTFTILSWFSDPQYDSYFAESETTELGVAFSNEGV
ncbi:hypothetical protein HRG19_16800, partial [Enterococcus faecalis]|nr:hypothetical protein [Enterococcus faecalis]